jgi:hypothetical protein
MPLFPQFTKLFSVLSLKEDLSQCKQPEENPSFLINTDGLRYLGFEPLKTCHFIIYSSFSNLI